MIKISIIIPILNEAAGIISFLTKLQPLRSHCELIVVDGGSDDQSCELARPYCDLIVNSATGRARQMNAGAARAQTETLLFLHADTVLPDNAVQQILYAIDNGFNWGRFDIKLSGDSFRLAIVAWMMNKRSRWSGIATGDQAIFVNRHVFNDLGGYADVDLMEDIVLSGQLKHHSKPYYIKSKVISSSRRWLQFGIFKTILLMWWLRLQFYCGSSATDLAVLYKEGRFWSK